MAFLRTSTPVQVTMVIAVTGLILSCLSITSVQAQNTNVVSVNCGADQFQAQSGYASNRDKLVQKLMIDTNVGIHRWSDASDTNNDGNTVYGKASCEGDVNTDPECVSCLQFINNNYFVSGKQCATSKGATVQLKDCFLEYENYYITW